MPAFSFLSRLRRGAAFVSIDVPSARERFAGSGHLEVPEAIVAVRRPKRSAAIVDLDDAALAEGLAHMHDDLFPTLPGDFR